MNDKEIFQKATQNYGGVSTHLPEIGDVLKQRFNIILDGYNVKKKCLKPFPKIIFNFLDDGHLNAFATKHEDVYIIAISDTTLIILSDLFNRMLSSRTLLPEVGNNSEETEIIRIKDYYTYILDLLNKGLSGDYKAQAPKNETRRQYAKLLMTMAMDFIFEHELAHILNGHVDWIRELHGVPLISEFQSELSSSIYNIDRQTLEMNADFMAFAGLSYRSIKILENKNVVHETFQKFYVDEYSVLSNVVYAILNVFRTFGDADFKNLTLGKSIHPDPHIRQLLIMGSIESIINSFGFKIEMNRIEPLITSRLAESEKAYAEITGNMVPRDALKDTYFRDNPLPQALSENWKNNMRDQLIPFAYQKLMI